MTVLLPDGVILVDPEYLKDRKGELDQNRGLQDRTGCREQQMGFSDLDVFRTQNLGSGEPVQALD